MAEMNVNKLNALPSTKTTMCKLCLTGKSFQDFFRLKNCKCIFCKTCLKQYLTVSILEGSFMKLSCPDGNCKCHADIEPCEVEKLVGNELYLRYDRLKFIQEVDQDPNRTFCPEAACGKVCAVTSTSQPTPVKCPACGLRFCLQCKAEWHPSSSCCNDAIAINSAGDLSGYDARIKQCPSCRVLIERNEGCAQMLCKRCKHVFCWYCLQSLDNDLLLRHYDSGPCRSKLGHSRVSLLWHRIKVITMQLVCVRLLLLPWLLWLLLLSSSLLVLLLPLLALLTVGLFAGICFMLLVVSPLILLAAPCFLCCKSMSNRRCKSRLDKWCKDKGGD